jgi:hypothetical protein
MLDGKILTAVFATLAALGTAMNGGHIDSGDLQDIKTSSNNRNFDSLMPESLGAFTELMQNPKPDTSVKVEVEIDDLSGQKMKISSASLYANNLTNVKIGKRRIESDEELKFYGFNGKVDPGTPTDFKGRSKGIVTSGVNISGRYSVEEEISTDRIVMTDVIRSEIKLNDISGSIKSNTSSTTIRDDETDLDINSFSGNITVLPRNRTFILDGKVNKLEAGDISFS